MKISKNFQLKIVIFTVVKNHCILHRHVFVMLHGHVILITTEQDFGVDLSRIDCCRKLKKNKFLINKWRRLRGN